MTRTTHLIRQDELPGSPGASRFIGADHGGVPISLFLVDQRPGGGPLLHRHPYPEVFVVHAGGARFEVDGIAIDAGAGDVLIAPAGAAHRFTSTGDGPLRVTAIHAAPAMDTEWLEEAPATPSPAEEPARGEEARC